MRTSVVSIPLFIAFVAAGPAASAAGREGIKKSAMTTVDAQRATLIELSDQIWRLRRDRAEGDRSSTVLADYAEGPGLPVKRGVAGMPTAFVAEFGQGKPVIGILGEYDALPGISQKAQPTQGAARGRARRATAAATTCSAPRASARPSRSRS